MLTPATLIIPVDTNEYQSYQGYTIEGTTQACYINECRQLWLIDVIPTARESLYIQDGTFIHLGIIEYEHLESEQVIIEVAINKLMNVTAYEFLTKTFDRSWDVYFDLTSEV